MPKIDVYGLNRTELAALRETAQKQLGKASVSLLAKTLLLGQLSNPASVTSIKVSEDEEGEPTATTDSDDDDSKYRLEVRLLPQDYKYIRMAAQLQSMSANAFAVSILRHYIDGHPTLSDKEAEALYQSNYQLLRIGRNLNQIARQLNAGESASLTTEEMRQLRTIIEKHTDVVGDLLLANKRRFE
ncbi:plasmid mobilization relaxosome protein MobC [Snodgrassella sp. CFCC 13594]|uniref:plasmid mobilization relaxosome protein MobC n=1 Tax=Snodgrassella sp. CFCC 13594 TaxID=1775559 RepID=UPI000833B85C|nr:plasmid mobilization relaxosome protein MobC [Snodgrassella sp. CFCC 13594]